MIMLSTIKDIFLPIWLSFFLKKKLSCPVAQGKIFNTILNRSGVKEHLASCQILGRKHSAFTMNYKLLKCALNQVKKISFQSLFAGELLCELSWNLSTVFANIYFNNYMVFPLWSVNMLILHGIIFKCWTNLAFLGKVPLGYYALPFYTKLDLIW